MICEQCANEHDGLFASGRFCSAHCARCFSTSKMRLRLNEKLAKERVCKNCKRTYKALKKSGHTHLYCRECKNPVGNKLSAEKILSKKKRPRYHLVRVMLEAGIPYLCKECGQEPLWNGKELTLQIDHIDGNHNNNEDLLNLRFLCPNCHTQTPTYGSKKRLGVAQLVERSFREREVGSSTLPAQTDRSTAHP